MSAGDEVIRRVESRVGKVALAVLGLLVATLIVMVPVGILGSSNLVWGEDNQYGRLDVPGTMVLHLPAGTVRVSAAVDIPGRGNATADLPLPSDLFLAVLPAGGSGQPVITRDVGSSGNANDNLVNTQRQVWSVQIPQDGQYRVRARGDFLGVGVNPQLWFGHGPPLPGTLVPLVAAGLVLFGGLFFFIILPGIRGRLRGGAPRSRSGTAAPAGALTARMSTGLDAVAPLAGEFSPSDQAAAMESAERSSIAARLPRLGASAASPDPLERLARLGDLHDRGVLTDAEFAAEKAKIIGQR